MRYSVILVVLLSSCAYNEITPVCEPDSQVFSNLVKPIIEANCLGCHAEGNIPPVLTTYDDVIDAVNNNALKNQVISLQMPPASSLNLSDINIIANWVDCE
jgi:hypothetical protein